MSAIFFIMKHLGEEKNRASLVKCDQTAFLLKRWYLTTFSLSKVFSCCLFQSYQHMSAFNFKSKFRSKQNVNKVRSTLYLLFNQSSKKAILDILHSSQVQFSLSCFISMSSVYYEICNYMNNSLESRLRITRNFCVEESLFFCKTLEEALRYYCSPVSN